MVFVVALFVCFVCVCVVDASIVAIFHLAQFCGGFGSHFFWISRLPEIL